MLETSNARSIRSLERYHRIDLGHTFAMESRFCGGETRLLDEKSAGAICLNHRRKLVGHFRAELTAYEHSDRLPKCSNVLLAS
ncbi:hypothetical protein RRSWK_05605 [Rhodopirellula sp. SWK7]|nr:hypothetical protein RRSWK_05605 [Rhodopirellula sp. SWK7]